jgi:hypothetical protein
MIKKKYCQITICSWTTLFSSSQIHYLIETILTKLTEVLLNIFLPIVYQKEIKFIQLYLKFNLQINLCINRLFCLAHKENYACGYHKNAKAIYTRLE